MTFRSLFQMTRGNTRDWFACVLIPLLGFLYFLILHHSPKYFLGGGLLLATYYFLWFSKLGQRFQPNSQTILTLVAIALPILGAWQYLQMADLGDIDQSFYSMALWNLRHGNIHFTFDSWTMFGIHSQYTAPLWIPVHWFFGDLGIKLGQGAVLIVAALLSVRCIRDVPQTAAWGALAIVMSPQIASQFFYGFHPEHIGAPVLVLALHAYRNKKLIPFLLCTLFLVYSKEAFAMAIGGILLLALVERRSWKWIFLPGILCCVLLSIYWWVVLPYFAPKGNMLSNLMPVSLNQIVENWLRFRNVTYVFQASLPFLPLLIVLPKRYLLLPIPIIVFYTAFPDTFYLSLWANYAFPTATLFTAGLVLEPGLQFSKQSDKNTEAAVSIDSRILIACAVTALLCYPLWREPFSIPIGHLERSRAVDKLNSMVPLDAPILVNGPFLSRFSARKEISTWGYRKKPMTYFDYAVIDVVLPFWLFTSEQRKQSLDSLERDPAWTKEYGQDGLYMFHRRRP